MHVALILINFPFSTLEKPEWFWIPQGT